MLSGRNAAVAPICVLLSFQIALAQQKSTAFTLAVVQGSGAINYVNHKPAQVLVVRVEDSSGHALAGAKVTFEAPDSGPGATFNGARTYAGVTGRDGTVKAAGFAPNLQAGSFLVHVVAEYEGQTEDQQIQQNNVAPPAAKSSNKKLALKIAIGAGACAAFGFALYHEFIDKNKPYGQR